MRGTIRVSARVARMTVRITVEDPADGIDITDVMLQPGATPSGWLPHVTELPWSAGVS